MIGESQYLLVGYFTMLSAARLHSLEWQDRCNGKDSEGNGTGLIDILSRDLSGWKEEN
jgi:hypothetical protein